jgi:prepilin-type N-terminal cleavage/methylation domain-containing protein
MRRQRAFTVIELIIVIAIIAILIALLLPAIQAARAAAMKNSGRNNMKQLALALQNHNDTFKTFPPLYFCNIPDQKGQMNVTDATGQYPWTVRVLPFIEEDTLYKSISAKSSKFTTDSTMVQIPDAQGQMSSPGILTLGQFQAPNQMGNAAGTTNYVALSSTSQPRLTSYTGEVGAQTSKTPPDGMIVPDKLSRGQSMARMADGTSKTAVMCESRELAKSNWYTPQQTFVCGFLPEDTKPIDQDKSNFFPYFKDGEWTIAPGTVDRTALNYGPPLPGAKGKLPPGAATQAYNGDAKDPLARDWGPSSFNMGGIVIHGMGDGSVQEITNQLVEPKVYFSGITTRGGENVGGFGF